MPASSAGGPAAEDDIVFVLQQQLGGKFLQPPHELLRVQNKLKSENYENHTHVAVELNKECILRGGGLDSARPGDRSSTLPSDARDKASKFLRKLQASPATICKAGRHVSRNGTADDVQHLAQVVVRRLYAWHSTDATMLLELISLSASTERSSLLAAPSSIFSKKSWLRNLLQAFSQARPSSRKYADRIVQKPVQQLYKMWKGLRAQHNGTASTDIPLGVTGAGFLNNLCRGATSNEDSSELRKIPEELKCVLNAVVSAMDVPGGTSASELVRSNESVQRVLFVLLFELYVFPAIARYSKGLAAKLLRKQQAASNSVERANSTSRTAQAFPSFLLRQLQWLRTTIFDGNDLRQPRSNSFPSLVSLLEVVMGQCNRRTVTRWPEEMTGYVALASAELALLQQRTREASAASELCESPPAPGGSFAFGATFDGSGDAVQAPIQQSVEVFHLLTPLRLGKSRQRSLSNSSRLSTRTLEQIKQSTGSPYHAKQLRHSTTQEFDAELDSKVPYTVLFELIAAGDYHLKVARARLNPEKGASEDSTNPMVWKQAWDVVSQLRQFESQIEDAMKLFSNCEKGLRLVKQMRKQLSLFPSIPIEVPKRETPNHGAAVTVVGAAPPPESDAQATIAEGNAVGDAVADLKTPSKLHLAIRKTAKHLARSMSPDSIVVPSRGSRATNSPDAVVANAETSNVPPRSASHDDFSSPSRVPTALLSRRELESEVNQQRTTIKALLQFKNLVEHQDVSESNGESIAENGSQNPRGVQQRLKQLRASNKKELALRSAEAQVAALEKQKTELSMELQSKAGALAGMEAKEESLASQIRRLQQQLDATSAAATSATSAKDEVEQELKLAAELAGRERATCENTIATLRMALASVEQTETYQQDQLANLERSVGEEQEVREHLTARLHDQTERAAEHASVVRKKYRASKHLLESSRRRSQEELKVATEAHELASQKWAAQAHRHTEEVAALQQAVQETAASAEEATQMLRGEFRGELEAAEAGCANEVARMREQLVESEELLKESGQLLQEKDSYAAAVELAAENDLRELAKRHDEQLTRTRSAWESELRSLLEQEAASMHEAVSAARDGEAAAAAASLQQAKQHEADALASVHEAMETQEACLQLELTQLTATHANKVARLQAQTESDREAIAALRLAGDKMRDATSVEAQRTSAEIAQLQQQVIESEARAATEIDALQGSMEILKSNATEEQERLESDKQQAIAKAQELNNELSAMLEGSNKAHEDLGRMQLELATHRASSAEQLEQKEAALQDLAETNEALRSQLQEREAQCATLIEKSQKLTEDHKSSTSDLKQQIAQLHSTNAELNTALQQSASEQKRNEALQAQKVQKLEDEMERLVQQHKNEMGQQLASIEAETEEHLQVVQDLRSQIENMKQEYASTADELVQKQSEIDQLTKQLSELTAINTSVQESNASLQQQIREREEHHASEVHELQQAIKGLKATNNELRHEHEVATEALVQEHTDTVNTLQHSLDSLSARNSQLEQQYNTLLSTKARAEEESLASISRLQDEVAELKKANAQLDAQHAAQLAELSSFAEKTQQEKEGIVGTLYEEIASLKASMSVVQQQHTVELARVQTQAAEACDGREAAAAAQFDVERNGLNVAITSAKAKIDSCMHEIDDLKEQITEAHSRNHEMQMNHMALKETNTESVRANAATTAALQRAHEELHDLREADVQRQEHQAILEHDIKVLRQEAELLPARNSAVESVTNAMEMLRAQHESSVLKAEELRQQLQDECSNLRNSHTLLEDKVVQMQSSASTSVSSTDCAQDVIERLNIELSEAKFQLLESQRESESIANIHSEQCAQLAADRSELETQLAASQAALRDAMQQPEPPPSSNTTRVQPPRSASALFGSQQEVSAAHLFGSSSPDANPTETTPAGSTSSAASLFGSPAPEQVLQRPGHTDDESQDELHKRISALETEIQEKNDQLVQITKDLSLQQAAGQNWSEQDQVRETHIASLESEREEMRLTIETLQTQLRDTELELAACNRRAEDSLREHSDSQTQLQSTIDTLRTQLVAIQNAQGTPTPISAETPKGDGENKLASVDFDNEGARAVTSAASLFDGADHQLSSPPGASSSAAALFGTKTDMKATTVFGADVHKESRNPSAASLFDCSLPVSTVSTDTITELEHKLKLNSAQLSARSSEVSDLKVELENLRAVQPELVHLRQKVRDLEQELSSSRVPDTHTAGVDGQSSLPSPQHNSAAVLFGQSAISSPQKPAVRASASSLFGSSTETLSAGNAASLFGARDSSPDAVSGTNSAAQQELEELLQELQSTKSRLAILEEATANEVDNRTKALRSNVSELENKVREMTAQIGSLEAQLADAVASKSQVEALAAKAVADHNAEREALLAELDTLRATSSGNAPLAAESTAVVVSKGNHESPPRASATSFFTNDGDSERSPSSGSPKTAASLFGASDSQTSAVSLFQSPPTASHEPGTSVAASMFASSTDNSLPATEAHPPNISDVHAQLERSQSELSRCKSDMSQIQADAEHRVAAVQKRVDDLESELKDISTREARAVSAQRETAHQSTVLGTQLRELEAEFDIHRAKSHGEIQSLTNAKLQLQERVEELEHEIHSLRQDNDKAVQAVLESKGDCENAKADMEAAQSQLATTLGELSELQNKLVEAQATADADAARIQALTFELEGRKVSLLPVALIQLPCVANYLIAILVWFCPGGDQ